MQELDKYLEVFHKILDDLKELSFTTPDGSSNVKLGGSLILKLHGLNFSRKSDDLDVIINNPTDKQKDYIKAISNFRVDETAYFSTTKYKFKKDDLYLNILISNQPQNEGCLKYKWCQNYYDINSINEVIRAKVTYGRSKDITDLLLLKNENFNLK